MTTRKERRCAYRAVVTALANAAEVDGYMERVAIAKAMDALGPIISDVGPGVVEQAITFRNGPLLRDHQPVDMYLQKDPGGPLPTILIKYEWVLGLLDVDTTIELTIIRAAHATLCADNPTEYHKLTDSWWAKVEACDNGYLVTFHYDREWPPENGRQED